jgi:hypothetical protein
MDHKISNPNKTRKRNKKKDETQQKTYVECNKHEGNNN